MKFSASDRMVPLLLWMSTFTAVARTTDDDSSNRSLAQKLQAKHNMVGPPGFRVLRGGGRRQQHRGLQQEEDPDDIVPGTGGPTAGSVPLYSTENPWTSFAGFTASSVDQLFGPELVEDVFGQDALDRAKGFVQNQTWLYCGTGDDPYGFSVELQDVVPGTAHFPMACGSNNDEANAFVNQGLTLRYAFNDNEAVCSYRKAQQLVPDCVMAYLLEALSEGPNVNYATIESPFAYRAILEAMTQAQILLDPVRDDAVVEKVVDFEQALLLRYLPPGESLESMLAIEDDTERLTKYSATYMQVNSPAYAQAMIGIHNKYPDDDDLATVAVGALKQSPSWRWWQPGSDYHVDGVDHILQTNQQLANATKANTILKEILARDPNHLGANHYMIHNMEGGPNPEWALAVADRIWQLDDHDGHITHMASHIYARVGYYDEILQMNKISNNVDFEWNKMRTGGGLMTTLYKYEPHNTEFNVVAGWDAGNFAEAAAHVALLQRMSIFRMTANPASKSLQYKLTYGLQLALRFQLWEQIMVETDPINGTAPFGPTGNITLLDGTETTCAQCYTWVNFARVIALSRLGMIDEATAALPNYVYNVSGIPNAGSSSMMLDNIHSFAEQAFSTDSSNLDTESSSATGTLTINNDDRLRAVRALYATAEVLRAQGLSPDAIEVYQDAWDYQKILFYDEPTPFFVPIAETLGWYLLEEETAALVEESFETAADLFRQVLFVHPMAIRSVLGLQAALSQQDAVTGRNDSASVQFMVDHVLERSDTNVLEDRSVKSSPSITPTTAVPLSSANAGTNAATLSMTGLFLGVWLTL